MKRALSKGDLDGFVRVMTIRMAVAMTWFAALVLLLIFAASHR